jgi:hypothetical protein
MNILFSGGGGVWTQKYSSTLTNKTDRTFKINDKVGEKASSVGHAARYSENSKATAK